MRFREDERDKINILKGILILFVVLGHAVTMLGDAPDRDMAFHDIIFWFHMPLFFALSGAVFRGGVDTKEYAIKKIKRFLPTYLAWFILITLIQGSIMHPKVWLRFLWGGRACGGVYWYITVLLFTTILFALLENKVRSKKLLVAILFICLFAAAAESSFIPEETWAGDLLEPFSCVPWNIDVTLAAVFYYGMGFVCRDLHFEDRISPIIATTIFTVLAVLRLKGSFMYSIDMKYVKYYSLFLDLVLPGLAAVILLWAVRVLVKTKVPARILGEAGEASLVIMYSHLLILGTAGEIVPDFTGRTIVLTIAATVTGYAAYRLFKLNKLTKTLFINGIK